MQPLIKAIILIIEKYVSKNEKNINGFIDKNSVVLKFRKDGKIYKRLKIEQDQEKIKVTFLKENIIKIVDLDGLDIIIEMLEKQCNAKPLSQEEIQNIKLKYVKGTKLKLIKMYDLQKLDPGTTGIVDFVDDAGQIHMNWENGRTLALQPGIDEFEILCPICGKSLKDKTHKLFEIGQIRPFAYGNTVYLGKITNIDEENHIYTLEEIENKKEYKVSQEYVFLGDD